MSTVSRKFISEGHLIDSGILTRILNLIIDEGAEYEIVRFNMGKHNWETSYLELEVQCASEDFLLVLSGKLVNLGCYEKTIKEAVLKPAPGDCCVAGDFYSTTNHRTFVFIQNNWREVRSQRMDGVIVWEGEQPVCKKLRDVRAGDLVVCNSESVKLLPPFRDREGEFGFMANNVSSERSVDVAVNKIGEELEKERREGGREEREEREDREER